LSSLVWVCLEIEFLNHLNFQFICAHIIRQIFIIVVSLIQVYFYFFWALVFGSVAEYLIIKAFFFFPVFVDSVGYVLYQHFILLLANLNSLAVLIFIFGFLPKSQLGCPVAAPSRTFLLFCSWLSCKKRILT